MPSPKDSKTYPLYFSKDEKKPPENMTIDQMKSMIMHGTVAPEYVACCQQLIDFFDKTMDIIGDFADPKVKKLIMKELDQVDTDLVDQIKERLK